MYSQFGGKVVKRKLSKKKSVRRRSKSSKKTLRKKRSTKKNSKRSVKKSVRKISSKKGGEANSGTLRQNSRPKNGQNGTLRLNNSRQNNGNNRLITRGQNGNKPLNKSGNNTRGQNGNKPLNKSGNNNSIPKKVDICSNKNDHVEFTPLIRKKGLFGGLFGNDLVTLKIEYYPKTKKIVFSESKDGENFKELHKENWRLNFVEQRDDKGNKAKFILRFTVIPFGTTSNAQKETYKFNFVGCPLYKELERYFIPFPPKEGKKCEKDKNAIAREC